MASCRSKIARCFASFASADLTLELREAIGDRRRAVSQIRALLQDPAREPPARRVVADDGDIGAEHLIAERVVVVIVRVDDIFDGLVRERLHVGDERGRRGRQ